MNARDYLNSTFIKKADLRASGPQRLTIKAVETAEGLPGRNGQPAVQELHLVFSDDRRFGLRATVNLRRMLEAFGDDTDRWPGQTIELYFSPDVTNPSGGEPGGIRLRVPETAPRARPVAYRNELEADPFDVAPALPEPAPKKPASRKSRKAAEDAIPFD